jgi:hypothetical protein
VEWLKVKALSSNPSTAEKKKKPKLSQAWWLMSVISATWEVELRKISV